MSPVDDEASGRDDGGSVTHTGLGLIHGEVPLAMVPGGVIRRTRVSMVSVPRLCPHPGGKEGKSGPES